MADQLQFFGLESAEQVSDRGTFLVPVNVTYYPIRSRQNALTTLASYLVNDIPERYEEELLFEGTMLLSGVDMDISFGRPLAEGDRLQAPRIRWEIDAPRRILPHEAIASRPESRKTASEITMQFMASIYRMTTVKNHDHLAACLTKHPPSAPIEYFRSAGLPLSGNWRNHSTQRHPFSSRHT